MHAKSTTSSNGCPINLASRPDASGLTYDWGRIQMASSPLGAKLRLNCWMQLEKANWQLEEVLVRESWSIFLEICPSQLGKGWTFIESPVVRVSSGPGALIPMVGEPCVSSQSIRGPCQGRPQTVGVQRRLTRKTTVIDLRRIPPTGESRRLSPGSRTTF